LPAGPGSSTRRELEPGHRSAGKASSLK